MAPSRQMGFPLQPPPVPLSPLCSSFPAQNSLLLPLEFDLLCLLLLNTISKNTGTDYKKTRSRRDRQTLIQLPRILQTRGPSGTSDDKDRDFLVWRRKRDFHCVQRRVPCLSRSARRTLPRLHSSMKKLDILQPPHSQVPVFLYKWRSPRRIYVIL